MYSPAHSIALDGYVPEGPRFDPYGPWANFNHHEGVSRLETRATCAQVLIAARQGLMNAFDPTKTHIFVNDCDEDVCLSVFILRNHELAAARENPLLNRLVSMEDMLDTTGGAYAFKESLTSLQQLLWIFEPYHEFRASGLLDTGSLMEYTSVIDSVGERISAYLHGAAGTVVPDTRYEIIERDEKFALIREVGKNGRLGVYRDGINAFVTVRGPQKGRFTYTLARSSLFVPFPIPKLLKWLSQDERSAKSRLNMPRGPSWGGSDIIAGSPRTGSVLPPEQVMKTIREALGR